MGHNLQPILNVPRPYQEEAVQWFRYRTQGRALFGDEMGLGKTGEIYMSWRSLGYPMPCILIAGKNAQVAWLNQAKDWGCPPPILIRGSAAQRAELWDKHRNGFVAITRESLKRDLASGCIPWLNWKTVIVDECHKDNNRKTGNFRTVKGVAQSARYVMLASGSIMRRGPPSLWGLLNIIDPRAFRSYWKFVEKYCIVDKLGAFGWEILGIKDKELLQRDLSSHLLVRMKKEVRKDMPPKFRDLDSNILEMTPKQADLYNRIREEGAAMLQDSRDVVIAPTILTKITRMRQILVTPKLLDPKAEYGAGIDRVIELLEDADDKHMCIFTPFASALPIIRQRLIEAKYPAENIILLRGGLSIEELMQNIAHFKATRGIAICSIKFAESFDLQPASWCIFLGYEWIAWDNMQAEDRLHRGEITNPVTVYYLRYRQGIDSSLMSPSLDAQADTMSILKNMDAVRKMFSQPVTKDVWS